MLQKAGGNFTLTADVNFGANYGLISSYFKSRSSNIADSGAIRLSRTDVINFRNQANSGNLPLGVDASNNLTWNGVAIATSSGLVPVASGGTGLSSYTIGDLLWASATTTLSKLGIGSANRVLTSSGSAPQWGLIVDANVDPAAAITRSKLASGNAYRILANNSSGVMSENAAIGSAKVVYTDANGQLTGENQLSVGRGGTGIGSYSAGDMVYGSGGALALLSAGTANQTLKMNAGATAPTWTTKQIVIGTAQTSDGSIAGSTSYGTPTNAPAVSITPTRTGTFKISGVVTLEGSVALTESYARINATSGSPTILFSQESYVAGAVSGAVPLGPVSPYTLVTLTAGQSYTFTLQVKSSSASGTITVRNSKPTNGVALVVEEIGF